MNPYQAVAQVYHETTNPKQVRRNLEELVKLIEGAKQKPEPTPLPPGGVVKAKGLCKQCGKEFEESRGRKHCSRKCGLRYAKLREFESRKIKRLQTSER